MAYTGSPDPIITTKENQEIIPEPPEGYGYLYSFSEFTFYNKNQNCHIIINNGSPQFLYAGQGWGSSNCIPPISSFKVVDIGTECNWIGKY